MIPVNVSIIEAGGGGFMKHLFLSEDTTLATAFEKAGVDFHSRINRLGGTELTDDDMSKTFREMIFIEDNLPLELKNPCWLGSRRKDYTDLGDGKRETWKCPWYEMGPGTYEYFATKEECLEFAKKEHVMSISHVIYIFDNGTEKTISEEDVKTGVRRNLSKISIKTIRDVFSGNTLYNLGILTGDVIKDGSLIGSKDFVEGLISALIDAEPED